MTDIQATQAYVLAASGGSDIRFGQAYVLAITQFPSEEVQVSQSYVMAGVTKSNEIRLTDAYVLGAVKGRTNDPRIRAWTYTLDGHDYYVLRLGTTETLVFDTHSKSWSIFGSEDSSLWKPYHGINWQGAYGLAQSYGSNVIVGDDGNGSLYFLNPRSYIDDSSVEGALSPRPFLREITGQVLSESYSRTPCFGVELSGSIGKSDSAVSTTVTLLTSDDQGMNYTDHGTVTLPNEDYTARADWRSLGSFSMPGRLFKVRDYGALVRIDYLRMYDQGSNV